MLMIWLGLAQVLACTAAETCDAAYCNCGNCDAGPTDAAAADSGSSGPARVGLLRVNGVWQEGRLALAQQIEAAGLSIVELDADAIRQGDLSDLDLLVVGGGWAWDQWQDLGPAGIAKIRDFVMDGGGYLGICAGAYLASDDVIWQDEWTAYPLNLFDGIASGPLAQFPWPEAGVVRVRRVGNGAAGEDLRVYYQGGALFAPRYAQSVTPLLRYLDIDAGSLGDLAALRFDYGAGRVLLSAVHLEMGTQELDGGVADAGGAQLMQDWLDWLNLARSGH